MFDQWYGGAPVGATSRPLQPSAEFESPVPARPLRQWQDHTMDTLSLQVEGQLGQQPFSRRRRSPLDWVQFSQRSVAFDLRIQT